ncbi:MAG: RluA family pseudouridine synthase, partial [Fibromonadales bacterium]|nr:RluA family pseudouridine synthase [Fibromonadales bacterium]
ETSGLIIAALSGPALREFGSMLRARKIRKEYLALVKGKMPQKSGKISTPLPGETKISETIWNVVASQNNEQFDLIRVKLETGHKHQIRIHFSQIGHPLLGDTKYGDFALNRKLKTPRLFLHSTLLEFTWQGKKMKFEAELPPELENYASHS